jgi:hypothetical protein
MTVIGENGGNVGSYLRRKSMASSKIDGNGWHVMACRIGAHRKWRRSSAYNISAENSKYRRNGANQPAAWLA